MKTDWQVILPDDTVEKRMAVQMDTVIFKLRLVADLLGEVVTLLGQVQPR